MVTKQFFQLTADVLKSIRPDRGNRYAPRAIQIKGQSAYELWRVAVRKFAGEFARQNPRFDIARFLTACGADEG